MDIIKRFNESGEKQWLVSRGDFLVVFSDQEIWEIANVVNPSNLEREQKLFFWDDADLAIGEMREVAKFTLTEVATKIGYASPSSISYFESGRRPVSLEALAKIAKVCGFHFNLLFEEIDGRP